MKILLGVFAMGLVLAIPAFAGECDIQLVGAHEVKGITCPPQEVVIGAVHLSLQRPVILCAQIKCVCMPEETEDDQD